MGDVVNSENRHCREGKPKTHGEGELQKRGSGNLDRNTFGVSLYADI